MGSFPEEGAARGSLEQQLTFFPFVLTPVGLFLFQAK